MVSLRVLEWASGERSSAVETSPLNMQISIPFQPILSSNPHLRPRHVGIFKGAIWAIDPYTVSYPCRAKVT